LLKGKLLKQVNDLHQELRDFLPERENGIWGFVWPRWDAESNCIHCKHVWIVQWIQCFSTRSQLAIIDDKINLLNETEFINVKTQMKRRHISETGTCLNESLVSNIKVHLLIHHFMSLLPHKFMCMPCWYYRLQKINTPYQTLSKSIQ
jgi:hypothetical protein